MLVSDHRQSAMSPPVVNVTSTSHFPYLFDVLLGWILKCLGVCSSHDHPGMQILYQAQDEALPASCRESLGEAVGDESPTVVLTKKTTYLAAQLLRKKLKNLLLNEVPFT